MDLDGIFGHYNEIKDDLKFITSSDIRVRIIISLKERQKKLNDLKKEVHTNSSTILHNMSQLESRNLIKKEFKNYSLSETGEIVAVILINTVNTFSVIKKNKDFWMNHEINGIPEHLIDKIEYLSDFKIIKSIPTDLIEMYKELLLKSENLKCILPELNDFNEFTTEILNKKGYAELILTNKALIEIYSILNLKDPEINEKRNLKFYKINSLELLLIVTDDFMLLNLPYKDGKYEFDEFLISENRGAVEWGNKLFNYYLDKSKSLNKD